MWLQFFRQLYSLETLDTRFVIPATAPPKEALEQFHAEGGKVPQQLNGRAERRSRPETAQPAHWKTPEFFFYYLVIGSAVPFMTWSVWSVSQGQRKSIYSSNVVAFIDFLQSLIPITPNSQIYSPMVGYPAGKLYVTYVIHCI